MLVVSPSATMTVGTNRAIDTGDIEQCTPYFIHFPGSSTKASSLAVLYPWVPFRSNIDNITEHALHPIPHLNKSIILKDATVRYSARVLWYVIVLLALVVIARCFH